MHRIRAKMTSSFACNLCLFTSERKHGFWHFVVLKKNFTIHFVFIFVWFVSWISAKYSFHTNDESSSNIFILGMHLHFSHFYCAHKYGTGKTRSKGSSNKQMLRAIRNFDWWKVFAGQWKHYRYKNIIFVWKFFFLLARLSGRKMHKKCIRLIYFKLTRCNWIPVKNKKKKQCFVQYWALECKIWFNKFMFCYLAGRWSPIFTDYNGAGNVQVPEFYFAVGIPECGRMQMWPIYYYPSVGLITNLILIENSSHK